jgi:3-phytase
MTKLIMRKAAFLPLLMCGQAGCATTDSTAGVSLPAIEVFARGETAPVGTANADAADDPAIWRNAADPARSLVLGTDKKAGLYVYGLDGKVRDFAPAGALNNVDLREVPDGRVIVAASDRSDGAVPRIALFTLDPVTGKLTSAGVADIGIDGAAASGEAYGFCMGAPLAAGELARAYVVLKQGRVLEAAVRADGGVLGVTGLRAFGVDSQSEGCVVDDATHQLYLGEENVGIWRFDLNSPAPAAEAFAVVGAENGLVADVEGLAIDRGDGRAWLVASSQGDNAYALFDLASGALVGRFRIAAGKLGATSETDGVELATGDFGPDYPGGLFVAQDGDNTPGAQNFKFVAWRDVLGVLAQ